MRTLDNRKVLNKMTLGQKLRFFRTAEGYSQKQIANILSIERSTYTYYECDNSLPSVHALFQIARLYGVSMELFVDERIEPFGSREFLQAESERRTGKNCRAYNNFTGNSSCVP